ncbi:MAG TPA: hypothetical protein VFI31_14435, partial [Pirellulales bacterium]|nr:hypothetical protein [Pirellulales bacterium]
MRIPQSMLLGVALWTLLTAPTLAGPPSSESLTSESQSSESQSSESQSSESQAVYETTVKPFLAVHCFKCHDDDTTRAGFHIDTLGTDFLADKAADHW